MTEDRRVVADDGVRAHGDEVRPEHVGRGFEAPRDARADGRSQGTQQPVLQPEARRNPYEPDDDVVARDDERRACPRPEAQGVPWAGRRIARRPAVTRTGIGVAGVGVGASRRDGIAGIGGVSGVGRIVRTPRRIVWIGHERAKRGVGRIGVIRCSRRDGVGERVVARGRSSALSTATWSSVSDDRRRVSRP